MDHNLEDSLNMEGIENMDFDHSGVVVNQEDIALEESSQASDMPMDLEAIEEQPTLLNAGNEEVIVSDFIGDQFGFQEYSVQGDNSSGANITIDANQLNELKAQNEQITDLQFADCITKPSTSQSSVITVKAVPQQRVAKKPQTTAQFPRQVAIAPRPLKVAANVQYAIAPKPVALVMNNLAGNVSKTVPMKNIVQGLKGNTVLAQIGKQLVMMPAGASGQKIKLTSILPSGSSDANIQYVRQLGTDSAQLIANKGGKPMRTKIIVQGQAGADPANQPAVITKIMSAGGGAAQARYVMQQKTVPISIGGTKVVLTTPTKQGVKMSAKKHNILSIKQQSPQVGTSQANVQTKKVVLTANPNTNQSILLKTATVKTGSTAVKDTTNAQGQRTQLHPINVPGKGIQFIKLVTNQPTAGMQKPALKGSTLSMAGKNFVLTDSKGNIIQMTAEKVISSQPPPLLVTTNTTTGANAAPKQKKLVRIAPISHTSETPPAKVREASKMAYCLQPKQSRPAQSLLISQKTKTVLTGTSVSLEEFNEMVDQNNMNTFGTLPGDVAVQETTEDASLVQEAVTEFEVPVDPADIKPTLASLISDTVVSEENVHEMSNMEEVEIEYENTPRKQERVTEDEFTDSMDHETSNGRQDENMLILPDDYQNNNNREHDGDMYQDDTDMSMEDSSKMQTVLNVEADVMPYLSPQMDQSYSDSMFMFDGKADAPGLRPRKACNCTKSQCLKLYCDCFANGEFCNKCNCNNCHNNLENEELRQKAIRACLERNPNAFRPKIGKAKSGGPDIIRRHNKGCNCKRSGCLKNYCECYEAKIACTMMCKCVGCRNIEETLERRRDAIRLRDKLTDPSFRAPLPLGQMKQPCSFMTPEVISAVAQCMLATVAERGAETEADPVEDILLEFSRCMADIISASHQAL